MGTWASAVTTAVAPVCWESKTFLTTVSGADYDHAAAAPGLPDPHAAEQSAAGDKTCGVHRPAWCQARVHPGDPGAVRRADTEAPDGDAARPKACTVAGALIYDKDKTSYRSEVDQALRSKPDLLYLNGYAPDVAVVLRDLYRAGYDARPASASPTR